MTPSQKVLLETLIRSLQMIVNGLKYYVQSSEKQEKLLDVTKLTSMATSIDAVAVDGCKATVSQQQSPQ